MIFSQHLQLVPDKIQEALSINNDYKKIELLSMSRIFIVGSGSSYSHGIFLRDALQELVANQIQLLNPYTFVRYSKPNKNDIVIHLTQEAKRLDNLCPLEFTKKSGAKIILFTSTVTEASTLVDEIYLFPKEHAKLLVSCESYVSAYVTLIKWLDFQKGVLVEYDWGALISKIEDILLNFEPNFIDQNSTFLYSGMGLSAATEATLKVNECILSPSEYYEIKHFSHGKHFVTYNKPWTFNIFYQKKDEDLIEIYKQAIFEKHHLVNYFKTEFEDYLQTIEWAVKFLKYIDVGMKSKLIQLENIPIRDKVRLPHKFSY